MLDRVSPTSTETSLPNTVADTLAGARAVDDLLREFDSMDIPAFQRGLVWERGNIELLLESLYYNTPCGSIVLWTPPAHLVPSSPNKSVGYLIIDGQQRLRSLHDVLVAAREAVALAVPHDQETVGEEFEDGRAKGIWCLNLGKVPEFSETQFPGGKRFSLFRQAADPRLPLRPELTGAPAQDREALLPLRWFLSHEDAEIRRLVTQGPEIAIQKAAVAVLDTPAVATRLRAMCRTPVFQVTVLDRSRSLADVIGIYNRINTAGKRVEAEERAFAHLVGACEDEAAVNSALEEFFERVHETRGEDRDDLLRRQRENRFGFKLFMRVFTIALAYHSDRSLGSAAFSFDAVNPRTLEKAKRAVPTIIKATLNALEDVSKLLSEALHCDDLRMVPSTSSLWPLFQLLIRFPPLAQTAQHTLASLAYRLSLAKLRKNELLELCDRINAAEDSAVALRVLDGDRRLTERAMSRTIKDGVAESESLTNRFALALYWLLRKRGARDFSYAANADRIADPARLREIYPAEPLITKAVAAERQHLVPYTCIKKAFGLGSGPRLGSHFVNDLGNLTYISEALNGFDVGLGSNPARLEDEHEANRAAHLLSTETNRLLKLYQKACQAKRKSARKAYRQFCSVRRDLIATEMVNWDSELRARSAAEMAILTVMPPVSRLVCQRDADIIQDFGFPSTVVSALLRLRGCEAAKGLSDPVDGVSFAIVRRQNRKTSQVLRVDAFRVGRIELKIRAQDLRALVLNTSCSRDFTGGKSSIKAILDPVDPRAADCLNALAAALTC